MHCPNSCLRRDPLLRVLTIAGPSLLGVGLLWFLCLSVRGRLPSTLALISLLGVALPPVALFWPPADGAVAAVAFGAFSLASTAALILAALLAAIGRSPSSPPILFLVSGGGLVTSAAARALRTRDSNSALAFGITAFAGVAQAVAQVQSSAASGRMQLLLPLLQLPVALLLAASSWGTAAVQTEALCNLACLLTALAMATALRLQGTLGSRTCSATAKYLLLLTCFHGLSLVTIPTRAQARAILATPDVTPAIGVVLALGLMPASATLVSVTSVSTIASAAAAQLPLVLLPPRSDWLLFVNVAAAGAACAAAARLGGNRAALSAACVVAVALRAVHAASSSSLLAAVAAGCGAIVASRVPAYSTEFMLALQRACVANPLPLDEKDEEEEEEEEEYDDYNEGHED